MIVVDTSVWVDFLNGVPTVQVERLRTIMGQRPLIVGDIILCEVLQGLRSEREARRVETALRRFELAAMLDPELAVVAATNYRLLRRRGITIRKTIDLIIGAFCIANRYSLLHADRDFEPMQAHLGLKIF